tara:strand:+ start:573 stop:704 length:132 start_codon:yes stop_codon:yes gene_type:complete
MKDIEPNIKARNKAKKLIDECKYDDAIKILYRLKIREVSNANK